ncbi:MAG: indole-3-glycerol phosphate synthase TrpC [Nitrospina sp.]|nr:indole-3-glycerol phosphate synthase TrpC [Nitrospina sp.]
MANILDKIFRDKKEELEETRRQRSLSDLKGLMQGRQEPKPVVPALRQNDAGSRIIAEIKRRTPFKGELVADFDALRIAREYAANGAAAMSILTESRHFGGQLDYLDQISWEVGIPLLRKDFIFSEYQVYEARAFGADFFLLIATSLDKNQLSDLKALGQELGMPALVEAHNEEDLEKALYAGSEIIGINNRDLTNGKTDLNITRRLLTMAKTAGDPTLVCESGIRGREEIDEFEQAGIHAFLIGETLMRAESIPDKLGELTGHGKAA